MKNRYVGRDITHGSFDLMRVERICRVLLQERDDFARYYRFRTSC